MARGKRYFFTGLPTALLPLTSVTLALLVGARLEILGRRLAQLVYWPSALQLALGTYHRMRLRASLGPVLA